MANNITGQELLEMCIADIDSISVPVGLTEQVAMPLCRISNNLKVLRTLTNDALKAMLEKNEPTVVKEEAPEDVEHVSEIGGRDDS